MSGTSRSTTIAFAETTPDRFHRLGNPRAAEEQKNDGQHDQPVDQAKLFHAPPRSILGFGGSV